LGSNVTTFNKGERVAGLFLPQWIEGKLTPEKLQNSLGGNVRDGLLQEYAVFNENEIINVPDFLSNEEAATLPCAALTAWHGLIEKGAVNPGSTVLIQGTGGVSLFSAQFALMAGAKVVLLSGSDEKLEFVKQLGVHHLINYNLIPNWEKEVLAITNNAGVDHVVEVVGSDHINKSIDAIKIGGTISMIGLINGFSGTINTGQIIVKQARLQGIEVGSKNMFMRMNNAIALHKIRPVVHNVYGFDEAKEALTVLEKGKHLGKIVLSI